MARAGAGEIILSALAPGTHLKPHCASSNVRLTCHLGIVCPDGARMRVGSQWGGWQQGRCTFFDDSYEHEVVHAGESTRVVLLIRFLHPGLSESTWMSTFEAGLKQWELLHQQRRVPPIKRRVVPLPSRHQESVLFCKYDLPD